MKLHSAIFYSDDLERIVDFYNSLLGFQIEYYNKGKFVSFIFPNNARLGIKLAKEERETPGKQTIFIEVDDIDEWYRKAKELKLIVLKELTQEEWAKNFSILDPDLNKIQFISTK